MSTEKATYMCKSRIRFFRPCPFSCVVSCEFKPIGCLYQTTWQDWELLEKTKGVNMELSDILRGAEKFLEEAKDAYNLGEFDDCKLNLIWLRKLIEDVVFEEAEAGESPQKKPKTTTPAADM